MLVHEFSGGEGGGAIGSAIEIRSSIDEVYSKNKKMDGLH